MRSLGYRLAGLAWIVLVGAVEGVAIVAGFTLALVALDALVDL